MKNFFIARDWRMQVLRIVAFFNLTGVYFQLHRLGWHSWSWVGSLLVSIAYFTLSFGDRQPGQSPWRVPLILGMCIGILGLVLVSINN